MLRALIAITHTDRHIAELSCGHRQILTSGCSLDTAAGAALDCTDCDHLRMPSHFVAYKETPLFTQDTVPAALLRDHSTKRGVWARIEVQQGELDYRIDALRQQWTLDSGTPGTIPPEIPHAVSLRGPVSFLVRFFRAPEA